MSIRARIALFGGAVIAVTLFVFGLVLHNLAAIGLERDLDKLLAKRTAQAVAAIQTAPAADLAPHGSFALLDLRHDADSFISVLDANGVTLTSTGAIDGIPPPIDPAVLAAATETNHIVATIHPAGVGLRVDIRPWSRPDLGLSGYVVAGQPTKKLTGDLRGLAVLLWGTSAVVLLLASAAGWRVAGRALKPLKTILQTIDAIAATEDLTQRLPKLRRKDELGRLTASFNILLDRIETSQTHLTATLDTQKRFVADASHELRTPLTTIRANAGFLLGRTDIRPDDRTAALQDIAAESERMSRLVQDLLTLARADAGHHLTKTAVDLPVLIRDVYRQAERLHSTREFTLETIDNATISANPDALIQLLWILIDNAVNHTPRGGQITLTLQPGDTPDSLRLTVHDDGAGIPAADLARIFDRFVQADRARTAEGAGLGLAIAHWIVAEHHGAITVHNNPDHGATFTIDLPTSDED